MDLYFRFTPSEIDSLTHWLVTDSKGLSVLKDALHSIQCRAIVQEIVDEWIDLADLPPQPTYVLVKAYGDGWIEVYGERHVRAKIVCLPSMGTSAQDNLIEEWTGLNLKPPYLEIDYPSSSRAAAFIRPESFGAYVRGQKRTQDNMALLDSLTRAGKILRGEALNRADEWRRA